MLPLFVYQTQTNKQTAKSKVFHKSKQLEHFLDFHLFKTKFLKLLRYPSRKNLEAIE